MQSHIYSTLTTKKHKTPQKSSPGPGSLCLFSLERRHCSPSNRPHPKGAQLLCLTVVGSPSSVLTAHMTCWVQERGSQIYARQQGAEPPQRNCRITRLSWVSHSIPYGCSTLAVGARFRQMFVADQFSQETGMEIHHPGSRKPRISARPGYVRGETNAACTCRIHRYRRAGLYVFPQALLLSLLPDFRVAAESGGRQPLVG